jgi:hypothetical protein
MLAEIEGRSANVPPVMQSRESVAERDVRPYIPSMALQSNAGERLAARAPANGARAEIKAPTAGWIVGHAGTLVPEERE